VGRCVLDTDGEIRWGRGDEWDELVSWEL